MQAGQIAMIVHRTLAVAEARAPISVQGTFIVAGSDFDAFAKIGNVLGTATQDILIVHGRKNAYSLRPAGAGGRQPSPFGCTAKSQDADAATCLAAMGCTVWIEAA